MMERLEMAAFFLNGLGGQSRKWRFESDGSQTERAPRLTHFAGVG